MISLPSAGAIPYAAASSTAFFASNPLANDVTLPPLPDALQPMGPPKAAPISIVAPLPPAVGPKTGPDAAPTTTGLPGDSGGSTTVNGMVVPNGTAPGAGNTAAAPGKAVPASDDQMDNAGSRNDTTITTSNAASDSSALLSWVQQNQDAAALARAARAHYNQNAPAPGGAAADDDLMLNIRYPYLWNQDQPPGGSAVIYTIKK